MSRRTFWDEPRDCVFRCAECGYVTATFTEYHPHAFCVLVKAGYKPWEVVRNAGAHLPSRPTGEGEG